MANFLPGVVVAEVRGSIGGVTFSRGAGGPIMRNRSRPINPRSALQSQRRAHIGHITKYWSSTLTEQQRDDWRAYTDGTSWTNKLGQSISINGLAAFVRLNSLAFIYSSTMITAAPTAMGHAGGLIVSFAAESDTGKLQISNIAGSFDKDTDDHTVIFFSGLPTEIGAIGTPKGFRYCGNIAGSSTSPPTFPVELTSTYTMNEGQKITIKMMFLDDDFRVSGPHWATVTAAPS